MMRRVLLAVVCVSFLVQGIPWSTTPAHAFTKEKKGKKKQRRPTLEYQKYRRTREVDIKMAEKRSAIRNQLEALLKYEKDTKERPALLFRLAENYFEEATAYFNQAQRLDEKLAKDPENNRLRREIDVQKKSIRVTEDKWRAKAIDQYKAIISEFPRYPELDQVYFYLAGSLWDLERKKEGLAKISGNLAKTVLTVVVKIGLCSISPSSLRS